jgi:xanthosine utilization system XapX-like protein
VHAERSLARPGGGSFLRTGALLLAMTFALLSGSVFSTQTASHAAPAVIALAGKAAPVIGYAVADTVAGLFMDQAVGDVDYFHGGNGGTGTGGPGDGASQSPAGKASRLGRFAELAATVFGMGAFELGWSLADGQDVTYADAPATDGTPTYPNGWAVKEVSRTLNASGGPSSLTYDVTIGTLPPDHVNTKVARLLCNTMYEGTAFTDGVTLGGTFYVGDVVRCSTKPYEDRTVTAVGMISSVSSSSTLYCTAVPLGVWPSGHACTGGPTSTGTTGGTVVDAGSTPVTTTTTTTCSGGGSSSTVTSYQPADDTLPHFTGSCPSGETVTGISQTTTRDSDGETVPSPLGPATAPIVPDAYPDCQPLGSCTLTLLRMAPDGALLANCQGTGACVGWQTQASPSTGTRTRTVTKTDGTTATEPAWTYRDLTWLDCRYGAYTVPISDCTVVPTEPLAEPTVEASNCDAGDFSFNPISWVVVPLKCLFIPRDSAVQAAATAIGTAWDGTAPAVVFDAIEQVGAPVVALKDDAGQEDCSGPPFVFPEVGALPGFTIHPLSTCNELTQYLLGIYMPIATALVYLGGFFAGTRLLLKTVNVESPVQS